MTQSSTDVPVSGFDEPEATTYIIIDAWMNPWGPFQSSREAWIWAKHKWPNEYLWDVQAVRPTNYPAQS